MFVCVTLFVLHLTTTELVLFFAADLARMYTLVSRLAEDRGRDELQDRFESHVHSQGVAAVQKCGESAQNVSGLFLCETQFLRHQSSSINSLFCLISAKLASTQRLYFLPYFSVQDPKMYVHALLEVHNKYKIMVEAAFKGDTGFIQALDKVGI